MRPSTRGTRSPLPPQTQRRTAEWLRRDLSPSRSTKAKGRKILDLIREKNGALDVTTVTRSEVEAVHDKYAPTPRKANYCLQVLSILFNHAIRLKWMTHNPESGVELFGPRRAIKASPKWFQKQYAAQPRGNAPALYYMGVCTGQRPGDVIKMRWDDFEGEYMTVRQEKCREKDAHKDSETLVIYCPKMLRDFLATWSRNRQSIYARRLREQLKYEALNKAFTAVRDEMAKEKAEARQYSLHGPRYVAAIKLAEDIG